MPEEYVSPYEQLLEDMDPVRLPRELQEEYEVARKGVGVVPAAIGLGVAYMVYRKYMAERIKKAIRKHKDDMSSDILMLAASTAFSSFVPKWVAMVAPYLVKSYLEGLDEILPGEGMPIRFLEEIAYKYAIDIGEHMNEVSTNALLTGYIGQVNRNVPKVKAAERAAGAYGVTDRGMNTLVSIWSADSDKKLVNREVPDLKSMREKNIIETQNELRARVFGGQENWAARTQAKQLVWMYGVQNGIVPATAKRIWVTAEDERVCPSCGPLHEREAPVGEMFITDRGRFWTPPLHINCRCDVILDFDFTDEVEEQLRDILEEEAAVSKAAPGDPFDRDNKGQFASRESRNFGGSAAAMPPHTTQPLRVAALERPKPPVFKPSPVPFVPSAVPAFAPEPVAAKQEEPLKLELKHEEQIVPLVKKPDATYLELNDFKLEMDNTVKLQMANPKLQAAKQDFIKIRPKEKAYEDVALFLDRVIEAMPKQMTETVTELEVKTETATELKTKWNTLDTPLTMLVVPGSELHSVQRGDYLVVTEGESPADEEPFIIKPEHELYQMRHSKDDQEGTSRVIADELEGYWMTTGISEIMDEYNNHGGEDTHIVEYMGEEYHVDEAAFYSSANEVIRGLPGERRHYLKPTHIDPEYEDYTTDMDVPTSVIADQLQLNETVARHAPEILVMSKGTEKTVKHDDDRWSNPGEWDLIEEYHDVMDNKLDIVNMPYSVKYLEPRSTDDGE